MSDPKIVTPPFGRDETTINTGTVSETPGRYPTVRMRRNRSNDAVRRMVAENKLSVDDLIWPMFIVDGENQRQPVDSMPGVIRYSTDVIAEAANEAFELGIPAVATRDIFGGRGEMHRSGGDCTHYCYTPRLFEPLVDRVYQAVMGRVRRIGGVVAS